MSSSRTPDQPSAVKARLRRLRGDAAPAGGPPERRTHRRFLVLFTVVVLLAFLGGGYGLLLTVNRPPEALALKRLADGTTVRLLAITREGPHEYRYRPGHRLARRFFRSLGLPDGGPPIRFAAEVPADALVVWLYAARDGLQVGPETTLEDGRGRVYRNLPAHQPLAGAVTDWRGGTLLWLALTNFDRTAEQLTLSPSFRPSGQRCSFTIGLNPRPAANWTVGDKYPLVSGDGTADLRVWQIRRVEPYALTHILSTEKVPLPHDTLLLADVDIAEGTSRSQPGTWEITVQRATTSGREELSVVKQQAGLAWLTNGRPPDELEAVQLEIAARKVVRDRGTLVLPGLTVPAKLATPVVWRVEADEPFPDGRFVAVRGSRTDRRQMELELTGQAEPGTEVLALRWLEGLDQNGRAVRPADDPMATLLEKRDSPRSVTWKWKFEAAIEPDAETFALAFAISYLRVSARVTTTLSGRVMPPRTASEMAGLGLILEPVQLAPGQSPRMKVTTVVPQTQAATSGLQPGDTILRIGGLPPQMLPRLLLRHEPGDSVGIDLLRAGQPLRLTTILDPSGA